MHVTVRVCLKNIPMVAVSQVGDRCDGQGIAWTHIRDAACTERASVVVWLATYRTLRVCSEWTSWATLQIMPGRQLTAQLSTSQTSMRNAHSSVHRKPQRSRIIYIMRSQVCARRRQIPMLQSDHHQKQGVLSTPEPARPSAHLATAAAPIAQLQSTTLFPNCSGSRALACVASDTCLKSKPAT
jgi:hypothetical protein